MAQEKKTDRKNGSPRKKKELISAQDRCRAVLSLWTERRTPSQVCREYNVQWTVLSSWQDRALSGMLKALQPRLRTTAESTTALTPRLQSLLDKQANKGKGKKKMQDSALKIEQRLEKLTPQTSTGADTK